MKRLRKTEKRPLKAQLKKTKTKEPKIKGKRYKGENKTGQKRKARNQKAIRPPPGLLLLFGFSCVSLQ